jgi:hypothetical protein
MSTLSDIGFPTPDEQAVNDMIMHVLEVAKPEKCERGFYIVYSDESGAEIFLQGNLQQELIGFNPHYAGKSRRKVGLKKAIERESSELDGGFEAWANPIDEDGEISGEYPFVFDAPDFRAINDLQFQRIAELQLTAFASNDFKIFQSQSDYEKSQIGEAQLAAKSFIPTGMFLPDEKATPIEPPRPVGMFAGEIKEYELKTNQLSGEKFYWLLVETYGGEIDVVADPKLIVDEPKIGGIVSGQFWLSGRVI